MTVFWFSSFNIILLRTWYTSILIHWFIYFPKINKLILFEKINCQESSIKSIRSLSFIDKYALRIQLFSKSITRVVVLFTKAKKVLVSLCKTSLVALRHDVCPPCLAGKLEFRSAPHHRPRPKEKCQFPDIYTRIHVRHHASSSILLPSSQESIRHYKSRGNKFFSPRVVVVITRKRVAVVVPLFFLCYNAHTLEIVKSGQI